MKVCLLRIADGRDDYHDQSWESAKQMLPRFDKVVTVDDREHELGFAGAIAQGWREVIDTGCDWVFHLELDFVFNAPVPLERMIAVLERHPEIVQMALMRQPVNEQEHAAGGIVQCNPDEFRQHVEAGDVYTTHRRYFTTNACVYPAALCLQGWPQTPESEGVFTHRLLADPDVRFAFWGGKYDPPMIHHIGDHRAGHGY